MRLVANYNRERNLLEAPSIRAALELLSDKEPHEQPEKNPAAVALGRLRVKKSERREPISSRRKNEQEIARKATTKRWAR